MFVHYYDADYKNKKNILKYELSCTEIELTLQMMCVCLWLINGADMDRT